MALQGISDAILRSKFKPPGSPWAAFGISAALLASMRWWSISSKKRRRLHPLAPLIEYTNGGENVKSIEHFGDYVVRQLGIPPTASVAPALAQAADDYLQGDKSKADKSRDHLMVLVTSACSQVCTEEMTKVARQLVEELDVCMLTYFAFHWKHAGQMVDQVIHGPKRKYSLKDAVLNATRALRFKKVMERLGPQQKLATLLAEMRLLRLPEDSRHVVPTQGEVLVPANEAVRSPVLLLIGGGMGAGKSTVVKEVLKTPFWSKVAQHAVVVEADAFKEKDVVYQALMAQERGDVSAIAQLVHEASTQAASSTLVTALNEGRDVIFDGTMSWEPFVMQTVDMVRDIHNRRYRLGPGYRELPDGTTQELYWEPLEDGEEVLPLSPSGSPKAARNGHPRLPYRIELVGVVCDAHLAVMRGMRRAILTGRGVPVRSQLRSHQLFARSLDAYCNVADKATIYSTNGIGRPPEFIGYKEGGSKLLVDIGSMAEVERLACLNTKADNALELFSQRKVARWRLRKLLGQRDGDGEFHESTSWREEVVSPERRQRQQILREKFLRLEGVPEQESGGGGLLYFLMRSKSTPSLHESKTKSKTSGDTSSSESDTQAIRRAASNR